MSRRLNGYIEIINTIAEGDSRSLSVIGKLQSDFAKQCNNEAIEKAENIAIEGNLLRTDSNGKVSFYGGTSNVPIINDDEPIAVALSSNQSNNRTPFLFGVSEELVLELLDLYFCWQHSYYNIFDKSLFLRDKESGGPFYSDFLLCTVLAHASHISERKQLRSVPSDASTAGDQFYRFALEKLASQ